jgi:agmatinase
MQRKTPFSYASSGSFLRVPPTPTSKPFGIAGIPWDGATTNRPGARSGPAAIRQASLLLGDAIHPYFDLSPIDDLEDHGDLVLPNTTLQAMRGALEPQVESMLARQHMVWLGGDHSVTLPLLRAYRKHAGHPLAVIHFDAHCDAWQDHYGEPSGHGTWVHEALTEGLVDPRVFVQLGIRSPADRAYRQRIQNEGGLSFDARSLRGLESPAQLRPVIDAVAAPWAALGNPPTYLTLDIDCLDPAFAPGTGTPEPAGLTSGQVMTLLESWTDLPFVGMDCVEVAPAYDHAEITSLAAAHFIWTYLCGRIRTTRVGA